MILLLREFFSFLTAMPSLFAETKAISDPEKNAESKRKTRIKMNKDIETNYGLKVNRMYNHITSSNTYTCIEFKFIGTKDRHTEARP